LGWGYETLVREVSDSLHLRRFCRIALTERVADESTVRKLVGRLGPEVIEEITRVVIAAAAGERRFFARAVRCDSTVIEADIRYPSELGPAADATGTPAREARRVRRLAGDDAPRVRDRSRAANKRLRTLNRTLTRRTGRPKQTALTLTGEAGELVAGSVGEARRLAARLRRRARGRGAQAKLAAARRLDELADRAGKVARRIRQRVAGEQITDRLVSIADPDARPIRKGKLRAPTEFGYIVQLTEITENTRRGARGLILPAPSQSGSPNEPDLLPATGAELDRLGIRPREVAVDGGFFPDSVAEHLPATQRTFIAGRHGTGSRRSDRRLARYRVGSEGRISHLKRGYGLKRSRLKGHHGARTWVAWGVPAYNLDTLAIRTA
jgi:IS5 family transposase